MQREKAHILKEKQEIFDREHGFNFIKCHLPLHYSDHIHHYSHITGFSTDMGEVAHVQMIKNGYYHSNHITAEWQILQCYNRLHQFHMQELNLTQLSLQVDNISHVSTVFTSMLHREEQLKIHKENHTKQQSVTEEPAQTLLPSNTKSTGQQLKGEVFQKGVDWTIANIAALYNLPMLMTATFDFLNVLWRQAVLSQKLTANVYNNIKDSEIWQTFKVHAFNQVVIPVKDFQDDQAVIMHPV